WNINQDEKKALTLRKCLILLHSLAERTGLEPATPGVTGPLSKSMFMRVSSQIVFQKTSKTCRFHAVFQTFIPKIMTRNSGSNPSQIQVHASQCAVQQQRSYRPAHQDQKH